MKDAKRFPIPESLINKPDRFVLHLDSLIHNIYRVDSLVESANIQPRMTAPENSAESDDNLSIGSFSSFEDKNPEK
jgi:hypothetical protein